jgi:hypothetical protein
VATLLSLVVTVLLLSRGVLRGTRLTAIAAVTSLVLTWGFAQRPYLLPTTLTIQDGAGDPNSLRWLVIVTAVAVLLVGPALALLYRLDLTDMLAADHDNDLVEAPESPRSDPATLRTRGRENRAERPDSPRAQPVTPPPNGVGNSGFIVTGSAGRRCRRRTSLCGTITRRLQEQPGMERCPWRSQSGSVQQG